MPVEAPSCSLAGFCVISAIISLMKTKDPLESVIALSIMDYLSYRKVFFWRVNNVGVFDAKSGFHRPLPKYSMPGVPDIIVIKDGRFIGLEVKRRLGKQSEGQIEFERLCKQAGGQYHLVRSIEDVQALGL